MINIVLYIVAEDHVNLGRIYYDSVKKIRKRSRRLNTGEVVAGRGEKTLDLTKKIKS